MVKDQKINPDGQATMIKRSECTCAYHHTPGMLHFVACCYDDEPPMDDNPEVIWLGPKCENHEREGRTWSTEPHDCPDCDEKAVKYIRAPIANGH